MEIWSLGSLLEDLEFECEKSTIILVTDTIHVLHPGTDF